MAEGKSGGLKYGCLGCLGVMAVLVLLGLGTAGMAWWAAGSQELQEEVLTPEIPSRPGPSSVTEGTDTGTVQPEPGTAAGRIELDLAHAGFIIEPGRPGQPLQVEATYDRSTYVLEESLEEGDPWIYRLRFRRTGSGLVTGLAELFAGTEPEVRLRLPVDIPLALDLDVAEGGASVELGGLWLTSADVDFRRGGFELSVDGPMRAPMERLSVNGGMGGFQVSGLGNASPRKLDVDFRMGGLVLDLRGRWVADSEIRIRLRMAGGVVELPDNAILRGLDVAVPDTPVELEGALPTLTFDTAVQTGELEFQ